MGEIRQSFGVDTTVERAFEMASDPNRFGAYVPLLSSVEDSNGRLDRPGARYTLVFRFPLVHLRVPWEVIAVRPEALAGHPRPEPPREIEESGRLPFGLRAVSVTRFERDGAKSVVSHVFRVGVRPGRLGRLVDRVAVSPAFRLAMGYVGRRFARVAGGRP